MWQKIKKGLQVFAIIGMVYFSYKIFFVYYPNEDKENLLLSTIGLFTYGNLLISTLSRE